MAKLEVPAVRIAGLASAVPEQTVAWEDNASRFGLEAARSISSSTGVKRRHVVAGEMCTSDLCKVAADRLMADLRWDPEQIDLLIFVSQTPDHVLPATSCLLQSRLGLSDQCAAFDVNLGCSGFVYGLCVASQMISTGGMRRALLLAGDTITRLASPDDRSTSPLFGDAGSATALEFCPGASPMSFTLGTDGSGGGHLMVPAGGFRQARTVETSQRQKRADGNLRCDEDLYMNGPEIFAFTLREVPTLIRQGLKTANWTLDDVDGIVMHQANAFILRHVAKRLKLPAEKVVMSLEPFGNTSSASIPLAISHALADRVGATEQRLLLAGFGVGFSWASAAIHIGPIAAPEVIFVDHSNVPTREPLPL
ncbi:ketoacyl-ACP synthase III [Pirellulales bacterium]|nr:ketoacyl-ACP synthase III [Pirellulales bacterium]